jgi:hypothetical protein
MKATRHIVEIIDVALIFNASFSWRFLFSKIYDLNISVFGSVKPSLSIYVYE